MHSFDLQVQKSDLVAGMLLFSAFIFAIVLFHILNGSIFVFDVPPDLNLMKEELLQKLLLADRWQNSKNLDTKENRTHLNEIIKRAPPNFPFSNKLQKICSKIGTGRLTPKKLQIFLNLLRQVFQNRKELDMDALKLYVARHLLEKPAFSITKEGMISLIKMKNETRQQRGESLMHCIVINCITELMTYLKQMLSLTMEGEEPPNRLQILFYDHGHWIALDILASPGKIKIFALDAYGRFIESLTENFKKWDLIPHPMIDLTVCEAYMQRIAPGCSIFAPHHAFQMVKTSNLHALLEQKRVFSPQLNSYQFDVFDLPEGFIKNSQSMTMLQKYEQRNGKSESLSCYKNKNTIFGEMNETDKKELNAGLLHKQDKYLGRLDSLMTQEKPDTLYYLHPNSGLDFQYRSRG